jgi:hypothetical protein
VMIFRSTVVNNPTFDKASRTQFKFQNDKFTP